MRMPAGSFRCTPLGTAGINGLPGTKIYLRCIPSEQQQEVLQLNQHKNQTNPGSSRNAIREMTLLSLFTAIIILMACTPIGLIDLPLIKATILHVPVIIGAILLGPKKGIFLGAVFGITSVVKNTMVPSLLAFAFSPLIPVPGASRGSLWALVISMVPRMLIGLVAWAVYALLSRLLGKKLHGRTISMAVAAVAGAITNTALVMGLIYLLFQDAYALANNLPVAQVSAAIMAVVAGNGIPEAIAAAVLVPAVGLPLQKVLSKGFSS